LYQDKRKISKTHAQTNNDKVKYNKLKRF